MKVLAYGHRRISGRRFSPEVTTGITSVSAGYQRSGKEKRVVVLWSSSLQTCRSRSRRRRRCLSSLMSIVVKTSLKNGFVFFQTFACLFILSLFVVFLH